MYKLIYKFGTTELNNIVLKIDNNLFIPFDPANTDYQEYLKWLAEGNQPQAAE